MLDWLSRSGKRMSRRYHPGTNRSNAIWCLMSKWGRTSAGRLDLWWAVIQRKLLGPHLLFCSFQGLSEDNSAGGGIEWSQYYGL